MFFGSPAFAVPTLRALLASSHVVAGVVTQPDRPRGRGQKISPGAVAQVARAAGLPLLQPARLGDADLPRALAALGADLGVVAAYGKILPEWLLALPPRGLVNVHASLLPAWRGAAPVHRAIIAGDAETGVTIMRVVKALDAGAMLDQTVVAIGPDVTSVELEDTLAVIGAERLVATVDRLAAGPVDETPQDEGRVTYAAKITRADSAVDWRAPARAVHDRIRGLHPWPHASAALAGARVILHRSQRLDGASDRPPATIVSAGAMGVDVATGDGGVVRLLELQAEGGRRLAAADFLAGRPLGPGMAFDLP